MEKKLQQLETNCLRIVLYGPESTGKTTIAKALALHYKTEWIPEFARDYLQSKWNQRQEVCSLKDLLIIAEGQIGNENKGLLKAKKFLFCDTNVLVTKAWSETHFGGYCDPQLKTWADEFYYDHYFLTYFDVPWEEDDLRDRPKERRSMFNYFKELLDQNDLPYTLLKGNHHNRMKQAIKTLDSIQSKNS